MKRLLLILTMCLLATIASAQKNMEISPLFEGTERAKYGFSAVVIEGKSLKKYNLTLFKSVTTSKTQLFDELEGIVESDSKEAIDKECGYINGKLYYGFYQFKPTDGKYRYIFYRNSSLRDDEPDEVTIVYMEGYPTLEELKKMFRCDIKSEITRCLSSKQLECLSICYLVNDDNRYVWYNLG